MDVFVARQPIFDRALNSYGYELLFRSSEENRFDGTDPDEATHRVVAAWFQAIGMERLTAGKHGFVNFTANLLTDGTADVLDPATTVIELLESVPADAQVLAATADLREAGFRIALDDYATGQGRDPLLAVSDIVKVDWLDTTPGERIEIATRLAPDHDLLAEKVETPEAFDEAKGLGFEYFQGHFFARPEIVPGRHVPIPKLHYLRVVREINRPDFRFAELAGIVHRDASLAYRLLRYINSAAFGWRTKVHSIQHALVLLGEREIRRWATLAALGSVAEDRPAELVTASVIRGRFCETLAYRIRLPDRAMDLFFLGMLSHFDTIVGRPMEEILESIDLPDDVLESLLDPEAETLLRSLLDAVLAYEDADWDAVTDWCRAHRIDKAILSTLYLEAVEWAEALNRPKA